MERVLGLGGGQKTRGRVMRVLLPGRPLHRISYVSPGTRPAGSSWHWTLGQATDSVPSELAPGWTALTLPVDPTGPSLLLGAPAFTS